MRVGSRLCRERPESFLGPREGGALSLSIIHCETSSGLSRPSTLVFVDAASEASDKLKKACMTKCAGDSSVFSRWLRELFPMAAQQGKSCEGTLRRTLRMRTMMRFRQGGIGWALAGGGLLPHRTDLCVGRSGWGVRLHRDHGPGRICAAGHEDVGARSQSSGCGNRDSHVP